MNKKIVLMLQIISCVGLVVYMAGCIVVEDGPGRSHRVHGWKYWSGHHDHSHSEVDIRLSN